MLIKLNKPFYDRDTTLVAKELLGKYLVHIHNDIEYIGKIVEVEAYVGQHDLACHAAKGLTPRTAPMFGPPGKAYIYLIYGMYHCMNVVTEKEGHASAVLLRAIEPIKNITTRTEGPGLLCKAMHIDKNLNKQDLTSNHFFIAENIKENTKNIIIKKPRIGVHYAKHWANRLLRFYLKDNPFISKS